MKPILFIIGLSLAAFMIVWGLASSAQAQSVCGARAQLLNRLATQYGEAPVGMGLTSGGAVFEVLASPSGSWTVLLTQPSGTTCMVAAGEDWTVLPALPRTAFPTVYVPVVHKGCVSMDEVMTRFFLRLGATLRAGADSIDSQDRAIKLFFMLSPDGEYVWFAIRDGCLVAGNVGSNWHWYAGAAS